MICKRNINVLGVLLVMLCFFAACQRHQFNTDPDARLTFSMDTVSFDTVFTSIGSVTMYLKVYNNYKQDLEIDEIKLNGGAASNYRINIDGAPELSVTNKRLRAKDSMFIFVDVNVDPSNVNLPFLVEDHILFNTNGTEQKVLLRSYGQDAHHIKVGKWGDVGYRVEENAQGGLDSIKVVVLSADTTLLADKPYYFHDDFEVGENVKLVLDAGVRFYISKDKNIDVYGSLQANGTVDAPVVFRGHRTDNLFTDTPYDKVPGQWGTMSLHRYSFDNTFKHTHIRNALGGLYVDSLSVNDNPKVRLENCRIENMTSSAVHSVNGDIYAENSIFANSEQYLLLADKGGKYNFVNCTFANYYDWGTHVVPSVTLRNYQSVGENIFFEDLQEANFVNCIIDGKTFSELKLDNKGPQEQIISSLFNYSFENCLIKTNVGSIDTSEVHFTNVIWNKNPLFREPNEDWDFHPDTLSPVIDAGKITHLTSDMNEVPYIGAPEIGALEFAGTLPEEKDEE